jgi:hypothetical protein
MSMSLVVSDCVRAMSLVSSVCVVSLLEHIRAVLLLRYFSAVSVLTLIRMAVKNM